MKKIKLLFFGIIAFTIAMATAKVVKENYLVNYDAFELLVKEVKQHRATHLVDLSKFQQMAKEPNTIILDSRSKEMYDAMHIKGAKHLNFSDFNIASLARLIPNKETQILIYCNNNFLDEPVYMISKAAPPIKSYKTDKLNQLAEKNRLSLALNIPTYINLYGYGYKNVYELRDLVNITFEKSWIMEGTAVTDRIAANTKLKANN